MSRAIPRGLTVEQYIAALAREGDMTPFYQTTIWRKKRAQILALNHYECRRCKSKAPAVYTRATTVHHVMHLQDRPDLALAERFRDESGEHEQLVALCADCHDAEHERNAHSPARTNPIAPERW